MIYWLNNQHQWIKEFSQECKNLGIEDEILAECKAKKRLKAEDNICVDCYAGDVLYMTNAFNSDPQYEIVCCTRN